MCEDKKFTVKPPKTDFLRDTKVDLRAGIEIVQKVSNIRQKQVFFLIHLFTNNAIS